MSPKDRQLFRIVIVVQYSAVLLGLLGGWITKKSIFMDISIIIIGANLLIFNRVIFLERSIKYPDLNHKFLRCMGIFIAVFFVIIGTYLIIDK